MIIMIIMIIMMIMMVMMIMMALNNQLKNKEVLTKVCEKNVLKHMKQGIDSMRKCLDGLFAEFNENTLLKSYLMDYALKILIYALKIKRSRRCERENELCYN